jgi:Dolichyl-phosphate-mannose-protein mannosyltransferase
MTDPKTADRKKRLAIALILVLWTALLLAGHTYWMATFTGGLFQEDTAIVSPAVSYLNLLESQSHFFDSWLANRGDPTRAIDFKFMIEKVVIAPYLWAFLVYPPLPSALVTVSLAAFKQLPNAPFLPVFLYLPLLVLGTYLLARRFVRPEVAALAAMLVPVFPGCFYLHRQLYAAYPMTVALTFVYWSWLRSEMCARPRRAALFGVFVGLLLLVKHTSGVFLLVPAVWTLVELGLDFKRGRETKRPRLIGIALAVLTTVAVGAVWYGPGFHHLFFTLGFQALRSMPPFEPLFYPRLTMLMAGRVATLAFLLAVVAVLIQWRRGKLQPTADERRAGLFFALWIAVPIAAFSFLPVVNMEVTLPIMPAIAIVIAAGAVKLGPRRWAIALLALLAVGHAAAFGASLKVYGLPFDQQLYEPHFAGTDDFFAEFVGTLGTITDDLEEPSVAIVPFADIYVADTVFAYYAFLHDYRFRRTGYWFHQLCGDMDPEAPAPAAVPLDEFAARIDADQQFQYVLQYSDVIVIIERDRPLREHTRQCDLGQATRLLLETEYVDRFADRATFPVPGGGTLTIFRRLGGPAPERNLPPDVPQGSVGPPTKDYL